MNRSAAAAASSSPVTTKTEPIIADDEREKTQVPATAGKAEADPGHASFSVERSQDAESFGGPETEEASANLPAANNKGHAAPPTANTQASIADDNNAKTVAVEGLSEAQAMEIRGAIQSQQKFLGELLEHGHRWELEGAELRIFFAKDKRPFAEMVEGRDSLEKIRATASQVLNRAVRVCAKIESVAGTVAPASRAPFDARELRAKFESDPIVRSMLQRFGGKITEVKRREEGL